MSWKSTPNDAGGTTYTGVANTDYAFMWAYNTHNKSDGDDVALNFKPWVTILDVEINGPETADAAIKMSAVQLVSTTGETLNGQFTMDFTAVETIERNIQLMNKLAILLLLAVTSQSSCLIKRK